MQQNIRVKFQGGREVTGILKGFDKLLNLVLDETIEYMRGRLGFFETKISRRVSAINLSGLFDLSNDSTITDVKTDLLTILFWLIRFFAFLDPEDTFKTTDETRSLGLVVCRGPGLVVISPVDGSEQIANPFLVQE